LPRPAAPTSVAPDPASPGWVFLVLHHSLQQRLLSDRRGTGYNTSCPILRAGTRGSSLRVCKGFPMGRKLYVGNLTYGVTDRALEEMFAAHGTVQSAQVIRDRDTGRSKGFGFVEMGSDQEAQAAIAAMNGKEVDGRALTVNEAKPREDRGGGGRGGFGGG